MIQHFAREVEARRAREALAIAQTKASPLNHGDACTLQPQALVLAILSKLYRRRVCSLHCEERLCWLVREDGSTQVLTHSHL